MPEYKRETLRQHEQLRILYDRMRVLAQAPASALPESRMSRLLAHECADLMSRLTEHMLFEERGGYMADVYRRAPNLAPQLDALQVEHKSLTASLLELIALAEASDAALEAVQARLLELLDAIARHDDQESNILQTYLLDDIGTGD